jgi:hypothetical protein
MVELPLPTEQKGPLVPDSRFSELIAQLSNSYRDSELPAILLATKLDRADAPVRLDDLAEVARSAFFDAHAGKGLDPKDQLFSQDSFRNIALHAVAVLQHKAVELRKVGLNESSYMLLVSNDDVRWETWRDGMEEFIHEEARAGAH